jgi:hypothetical protein
MDGLKVKVVENNDHLGQIISGSNQVTKIIDEGLRRGRKSLFGLLGPAFKISTSDTYAEFIT